MRGRGDGIRRTNAGPLHRGKRLACSCGRCDIVQEAASAGRRPADPGAQDADLAALAATRAEHHRRPPLVALLPERPVLRDPVDGSYLATVNALAPRPDTAVLPLVADAADRTAVLFTDGDLAGDAAAGTRLGECPLAAGVAPGALVGAGRGHDHATADPAGFLGQGLAVAGVALPLPWGCSWWPSECGRRRDPAAGHGVRAAGSGGRPASRSVVLRLLRPARRRSTAWLCHFARALAQIVLSGCSPSQYCLGQALSR